MDEDVARVDDNQSQYTGLFESNVAEICKLVHDVGGLVYMDGANLNALLGISRPGDMGFDACHINLHKTFSTLMVGVVPASGPVAMKANLAPFMPTPVLVEKDGSFTWDWDRPDSIGHVHSFFGNFGIFVRALTYIHSMGGEGLKSMCENAIINANYLRVKLADKYEIAHNTPCMHEVVISGDRQKDKGAKRPISPSVCWITVSIRRRYISR